MAMPSAVRAMMGVLGVDPLDEHWLEGSDETDAMSALDVLVHAELGRRAQARADKDWATADAVRDRMSEAGIEVTDTPGVLATVAGILSDGRVSIATVEQTVLRNANGEPGTARLVIGTHTALEQDLSETVDRLAASGVVGRVESVLRVEGD